MKTLEDSGKDPRKFWRTVKSATNNVLVQNTITTEEWFDHFHHVLNGDIINNIDADAIDEPLINTDNESAVLDEDITQLEVPEAIKALKKQQGSRSGWFKWGNF